MSVYKHILVAVDFSDINRLAVERASILARLDNCELILLHVIEHFPIDGGPLSSVFQYNTDLRFAKEHEVDLIVVAPHGQGVIGSLGSTATGVLNNAHCDVLAVREPDRAA